jgi:hypothetical protein
MSADQGYDRMLRCYPPQWRSRYGGEMTALLEDTYATASDVPLGERVRLVRSGLAERAREAGFLGAGSGPGDRVRAGSVLILCGWALFLVAGAMFGKFTDNWLDGTPAAGRWVANDSVNAVQIAMVAGCALVAVAALLALPAFVRLVRAGGWDTVRRPVARALVAGGTAALALGGGLAWAHRLSQHDRNGGLVIYGVAFVLISLVAFVALGYATAAAVTVARRIDVPGRVLQTLGTMALALAGSMALIFVGVIGWWGSEDAHAPHVLLNGIGNGFPFTSRTFPPTLVAAGLLMLLGLVLAVIGSGRVARSIVAVGRTG